MFKKNDDDDDYEPFFHVHYIKDETVENKYGYWEEYNVLKKSWFRLCDECVKKVCKSSESLCALHYNKENKPKKNTKNMKKKTKRLNTNTKKRNTKRKIPLKDLTDVKIEEIANEEMNESLGIVISISSSLNKKQISQVKEFITKFHNNPQLIQFTCESQPDYIDDTTTHVITVDSGSFTTTLTKQIIQACVRHIFIGSINWITSSLQQSCVLDHFPYEILRDKKSLTNTRGIKQCRFDQLPVFPSSCIISIECHFGIKQMQMTRDELIEIIELSGATLLNDYIEYKTLIILCNTKKEMTDRKKHIDNNDKTIYYCKPDFLFHSIVRHEIQSIKKYLW